MSEHVRELLALDAAGALEPGEAEQVAAHLQTCPACAAEASAWRALGAELRRVAPPRPSTSLVARTRQAVELRMAEREERVWKRAALAFVVAFAWTLTLVAWLIFDLCTGEVARWLRRPVGSTAAWYAAYLVAGWLTAGAAAMLLGRRTQQEGRVV
jgi:predicted anti-sigma-YlaC factor YlaD